SGKSALLMASLVRRSAARVAAVPAGEAALGEHEDRATVRTGDARAHRRRGIGGGRRAIGARVSGARWRGQGRSRALVPALRRAADDERRGVLRATEEPQLEPAEDVVDERRRRGDLRVRGQPCWLEVHAPELLDEVLERHTVLQRDRREHGHRVHQAADRRALLRDVDEDLPWRAVVVQADGDVSLLLADAEL